MTELLLAIVSLAGVMGVGILTNRSAVFKAQMESLVEREALQVKRETESRAELAERVAALKLEVSSLQRENIRLMALVIQLEQEVGRMRQTVKTEGTERYENRD